MIRIVSSLALVLLLLACNRSSNNTLTQVSTIDALLEGVYESEFSIKELKAYGDFGLGTINDLDGELVILDGKFYQIDSFGKVHSLNEAIKTPYVDLNFFNSDFGLEKFQAEDLDELKKLLTREIDEKDSRNHLQAIRIHGNFKSLKLRSVLKQSKPYPPLKEVAAKQSVFDYINIAGTLVAYRMPSYMKSITVPGYHFHFISDDFSKGGHVLAFTDLLNANLQVDSLDNFSLYLPQSGGFKKAKLLEDHSQEIKNIE